MATQISRVLCKRIISLMESVSGRYDVVGSEPYGRITICLDDIPTLEKFFRVKNWLRSYQEFGGDLGQCWAWFVVRRTDGCWFLSVVCIG